MDFVFHCLRMSTTGIKILGDLVQIGTDFAVLSDQLPKQFDICDNFYIVINFVSVRSLRKYSERVMPREAQA